MSLDSSRQIEVLVIGDREENLLQLELLLGASADYRLVATRSLQEALTWISAQSFAVILIDTWDDSRSGVQTIELIRKMPGADATPIIFVTDIDRDEPDIYRAYEAGVADYIFRPFDPVILRSKVAVFVDLHRRNRQMQQQLEDARRNAEAASLAKAHFLANVSHEIRTPLNAVMGFASLLLDPSTNTSDKATSLGIVQRNCQILLSTIDDLLEVAKLEVGELAVDRTEVSVLDLVRDIFPTLESHAQKKNLSFSFNLENGVPDKIVTDKLRLRQILLNVIGNAIKFTPKGSVSVTSAFHQRADKGVLEFRVSDTGIGVDPTSIERIFTPFSQADSSPTRLFGGTGLGLALSRRLARALGGDVRLMSSCSGEGSSFLIEVTVQLPNEVFWLSEIPAESVRESQATTQNLSSDRLRGRRILLVEDVEDNQVLIEFFLSQTGVVVDIANNGQEAVEMALSRNYEAVLMDIQMPLMDGYQATRKLRGAGFKTPIIALTAHALEDDVAKCIQTGCSGHLTKPIDRSALIDSLIRYMV